MYCEPDHCPRYRRLPAHYPTLFTATIACYHRQPSPTISLSLSNGCSTFHLELTSSQQLDALLALLSQVSHYLQNHLHPTIPAGGPDRHSLHSISTQAP